MISDAIKSTFSELWANVLYYVTFSFLDPFWGWLCMLIGLYFVVLLICYFFGSFFPILRVIGGVLLLIATFGLFTYRKGEADARAHDLAKRPKPKPQPNNPNPNQPWKWPWEQ